eukprot:333984_1
MATSALMFGGAYVAGTFVNHMNNQKKEEILQKLQQKKIDLLEEKTRWLIIKSREEKRYSKNKEEINNLRINICNEEKAISQYENAINDFNTKFIVIIGNTGDGKSTLCNRLYNDKSEYGNNGPFKVSHNAKSQTKNVKHIVDTLNKYVIVDTPGINDSEQKDDHHINDLVNYLYGCGGVNAFILVRNGTNIRFDSNFQKMLSQYEGFFGDKFWNHLIIVLTRIEGKERKRFMENRKDKELQNSINKKFKFKIPIFSIGNDSYIECIDNIRKYVGRLNKFECKDLKSPIDEFRDELELLIDSMDDFGANLIDDAQANIDRIDLEITKIQTKIDNPSQIPLIKSAVKAVNNSVSNSISNSIASYIYKDKE